MTRLLEMVRERTRRHFVAGLLLMVCVPGVGMMIGCEPIQGSIRRVGEEAKAVARSIDPTGSLDAVKVKKEMGEATERALDNLDIEAVNQAVAGIESTAASIKTLSESLTTKVEAMEVGKIGAVLNETQITMVQLRDQIEQLHEHVTATLKETQELLASGKEAIDAFGQEGWGETLGMIRTTVSTFDEATVKLPETLDEANLALATVRRSFRLMTVALVLMSGCTFTGLMLWWRNRPMTAVSA